MQKRNKKLILCIIIVILIFLLDRFTKIYILNLAEVNNTVDIFLTEYLNIYLVWNKGIAFGLLNFEQSAIYNSITLLIGIISIILLIMIIKTKDLRAYFYILIFGGALAK